MFSGRGIVKVVGNSIEELKKHPVKNKKLIFEGYIPAENDVVGKYIKNAAKNNGIDVHFNGDL